ncbi:9568_t:CDS:2 [Funneliformis geosporum]|uniref:9568_t:CDS:1 n=1 Tax=Funneliformis geosporum TaxID=1117311 RepID=A0A9W4SMY8_9GLOM|nr:9568_t:CDS:2 [Funneliformis geosporum]
MSSDIRTPIYQEKIGISIKEVYSFTPIARDAFSSVLVGNALYFFGGQPYTISNETFYLDVSQSFNSENPPWIETPSAAIPFGSIFATVSSTIVNNNPSIYLFGGFMFDPVSLIDSFISFVYTFDPQTFKWDIPQTKGQIPTRRRDIEAVNDSSGKIYIFGGSNDFARPFTYFNDMIIFDTNILTWSYGTTFNAPKSLFAYTATLLSNGVIPKPNPTKSQIPSNSPNSYNSPNSSKDLTTTKIVISVISSIVGTTFLIGIGMLLYRLYKKGKEKQTLRISGNLGSEYNVDNHHEREVGDEYPIVGKQPICKAEIKDGCNTKGEMGNAGYSR